MSILVSGITKTFGTQKALDNVSLEIMPGGITGLLGPNGAGKTTLMKILACYQPPTSGTASVCGFDVRENSIEVRERVGYLPENNPLYTDLYVREFLQFMAGVRKLGGNLRARVDEMIEMTGLEREQNKKIGALSKGYRQRVGLAHALIHDPPVLILDEPTSGLDPNQILEIRNLITRIGKTKTVIMSTHIMQEVEAICERAVIIHKGRIIADDATANLHHLAAPKPDLRIEFNQPVAAGLLLAVPGITSATPGSQVHAGTSPKGKDQVESATWTLTAAPGADVRPDLFRFAVEHDLMVLSLHREEQKLEEVFQELTRG